MREILQGLLKHEIDTVQDNNIHRSVVKLDVPKSDVESMKYMR